MVFLYLLKLSYTFFFFSVNMMKYIDFSNFKAILSYWDKPYLRFITEFDLQIILGIFSWRVLICNSPFFSYDCLHVHGVHVCMCIFVRGIFFYKSLFTSYNGKYFLLISLVRIGFLSLNVWSVLPIKSMGPRVLF